MKLRYLFSVAAVGALLASCSNGVGGAGDKSVLNNADFTDSVSWYLGESAAMYYWKASVSDTLLASDAGREAYEKGFRKGLEMLSSDNAYNEGIRAAINMGQTFAYLSKDYNVEVNKSIFLSGMDSGMASDTAVNRMELQQQLSLFFNQMQQKKEEKMRAEADKSISKIAEKRGFKKISDAFYYKIDTESLDTVRLVKGNTVSGSISVTTLEGKSVTPAQNPTDIRVGSFPSKPVNEALEMMPPNSTYSFITTASMLFGTNVPRNAGITGETPVVWTLHLGDKSGAETLSPLP